MASSGPHCVTNLTSGGGTSWRSLRAAEVVFGSNVGASLISLYPSLLLTSLPTVLPTLLLHASCLPSPLALFSPFCGCPVLPQPRDM